MERERFSRGAEVRHRRGKVPETAQKGGLFWLQMFLSLLLIIAGFLIHHGKSEQVKAVFANSLTKSMDLSDVSTAVNDFVNKTPVIKDIFGESAVTVFSNKKKDDSNADEQAFDPEGSETTEQMPPVTKDGAQAVPTSAEGMGGATDTGGYMQYLNIDAGQTKQAEQPPPASPSPPAAASPETQAPAAPAIPANVVTTKVNTGLKLKMPITGTITSPFGYRIHPTAKVELFHYGLDIAANTGTIIHAAGKGTIEDTGTNKSYGNYVLIKHNDDLYTFYGHCSEVLVKKGAKVSFSTKIAKVGSTGISTGPHLHFEIRYKDKYINPQLNAS
ncbi:MAG: M23 family metallopeptidase [Bacillota bacterium]|nr:M23 family metallopeptidase [Bacillota bacterium]